MESCLCSEISKQTPLAYETAFNPLSWRDSFNRMYNISLKPVQKSLEFKLIEYNSSLSRVLALLQIYKFLSHLLKLLC